ncbi:hypothetical protein REPUB_Repub02eG0250500 [Reevesia pubescens]
MCQQGLLISLCSLSKLSELELAYLKVASQLNGSTVSTPVLKHGDGTSQKSTDSNKSIAKSSFELGNSIAMDLNNSEMFEESLEQGTDAEMGEKSTRFKVTGKSELTSIKDSCCSKRIIQCLPEEQFAVEKHH